MAAMDGDNEDNEVEFGATNLDDEDFHIMLNFE